jgi:hypothetical protein
MTELRNSARVFNHRNPFLEIVPAAGTFRGNYSDDLRVFASLYREALITESVNYQFLCYYRIAEGLLARRVLEERKAARSGAVYTDPSEVYPSTPQEAVALYASVFPVPAGGLLIEGSLGIPEALGRTFKDLLGKGAELTEIRDNIGHTLLQKLEDLVLVDDPVSQEKVERWLPPLKLIARTMLANDFPNEVRLKNP